MQDHQDKERFYNKLKTGDFLPKNKKETVKAYGWFDFKLPDNATDKQKLALEKEIKTLLEKFYKG